MRRSLAHYWRLNLAVLLAAAVATAVLTGALLIGDSIRGSLRDLTLDRLGKIDYALVTQKYFREDLLVELVGSNDFNRKFESLASAIIINGTTIHSKSKTRASKINVLGIDEQFLAFYETDAETDFAASLRKGSSQAFPSIVINQSLQNELQAEVGDQILLSFEKPGNIARGSLLGNKDTEDVVETIRLSLTKIIPDRSVGRFSLRPHQSLPLNAYVSLPVLQKALQQRDKVNALLISQKSDAILDDATAALQKKISDVLTLNDFGLKISDSEEYFTLESDESILSAQIVESTKSVIAEIGAPDLAVFTYLANTMEANERLLPYSTVTAINTTADPLFGTLQLTNGQVAPKLTGHEILLNSWAARDLQVQVGDSVTMSYFSVGTRDELMTKHTAFQLKGIVAMTGLAADEELTPDYPGISDVKNMADWDPPFPVDLSLIRPKDEKYWDQYRSTPKAFVAEEIGRELWGSRFGDVTAIRIGAAPNSDVAETMDLFEKKFLERTEPVQFGFAFQPIKKQGLASSSGTIDFSQYFLYFSFFLIVSAALLVGLLFRLGIEQRANEVGILFALGYRTRQVRGKFMREGGILAAIGAALGLAGAVLYAWLLMAALRTWWLAAVGTPFLFLHVNSVSLIMGYVGSLVVVFLSIWLAFRKLAKVPPPALLAGVTTILKQGRPGRLAKIAAIGSFVFALVLTAATFFMDAGASAGLFFGIGSLVLISGLAFFSMWLRGKHKAMSFQSGFAAVIRMAARNSPRNPGRSMLSAALVACACFVIVSVESFRRDFSDELLSKNSGAGGFSLLAEANVPLQHDLSTDDGRFELGFSDKDSEILSQSSIMPFRLRPGDDTSCLNLYQVEKPRLLGVTAEQIKRGGFQFQKFAELESGVEANPWTLLEQKLQPGVIPVFGDANSVKYILHSGFGKDYVIKNEFGEEIRLRFVGLFSKSIFQSELLISEKNFLKHFPSQSGYAYFLIQTVPEQIQQSSQILEKTLSDYGFDTSSTAEKLANFQAVENTYLSTFQTLGGFGLLLGTLGLGIILIRNVIERRGELATLRAFGFRQATLGLMVLAENGFLLFLGILIGTVSAVVSVAPHVLSGASQLPWLSLTLILGFVFLVGMLASLVAVRAAVKIPLLPALRAE